MKELILECGERMIPAWSCQKVERMRKCQSGAGLRKVCRRKRHWLNEGYEGLYCLWGLWLTLDCLCCSPKLHCRLTCIYPRLNRRDMFDLLGNVKLLHQTEPTVIKNPENKQSTSHTSYIYPLALLPAFSLFLQIFCTVPLHPSFGLFYL